MNAGLLTFEDSVLAVKALFKTLFYDVNMVCKVLHPDL